MWDGGPKDLYGGGKVRLLSQDPGKRTNTGVFIVRDSGHVRPRQGTEICNFFRGAFSTGGSPLEFLFLLLQYLFGRKHPSRDVIFSGQNLAKKCQKLSLYMTSSNL